MTLLQSGLAKSLAEDYTIDQSLRFDDGDSAYLERTPTSTGNLTTWTWSGWIKRGIITSGSHQTVFGEKTDSNNFFNLVIQNVDVIEVYAKYGGSTIMNLITSPVYRDPSSWYHIVVQWDTGNGVEADRVKLYVNGDRVTAFSTETTVSSQDQDGPVNATDAHWLGKYDTGNYYDGYLAEVYFIDGTALTPSSFGETDEDTNQWKPLDSDDVKDAVTFGTNGFYQKYAATELANSFTDSSTGGAGSPHTITANGDVANARGAELDSTYTKVDAITATGASTWTCPAGVTSAEILVVGGGGGSGRNQGGGGGAGGLVHHATYTVVPAVVYDITIGTGGAACDAYASEPTSANDGVDSVFNVNSEGSGSPMTAVGGGAGGAENDARTGGSGGGGNGNVGSRQSGATGSQGDSGGGTGYGNDGGDGASSPARGGGGGGADEEGNIDGQGFGGDGKLFSTFTGYGTDSSNVASTGANGGYFGGGGAGGNQTASPGIGGGGTNEGDTSKMDGLANTGGGGGANNHDDLGGDGGTGVVLIAYSQDKPGTSSIAFDGSGDYLSTPDSSDWSWGTGDFTLEAWVRPESYPTDNRAGIVSQGTDNNNFWNFRLNDDGSTQFYGQISGSAHWSLTSTTGIISTNSWHHVAVVKDGDDFELFIDGTSRGTNTDSTSFIDFSGVLVLGAAKRASAENVFDGYIDEIRISDSARYTSAFTPSTTQFTSDSNTLLLIHSDFDGGLGADSSGNYNTFTATNLVATDQMLDSPTNNFCTWNPLDNDAQSQVFAEGNLKGTTDGYSGAGSSFILPSSGKWYAECYASSVTSEGLFFGIADPAVMFTGTKMYDNPTTCAVYRSDGLLIYTNNNVSTDINTFTDGDIISIAVDVDADEIWIGKNNVWQGASSPNPSTGTSGHDLSTGSGVSYTVIFGSGTTDDEIGIVNFGQDSSFAGNVTAQGNQDGNSVGDFYYEPPTDFLALCTSNLSDPEIKLPGDNFNTVLYTGDGADDHAITGVGFQPDNVWIKSRSVGDSHVIYDVVRGATKFVSPNNTNAEVTATDGLVSFDTDGFTLNDGAVQDQANRDTQTYASWNWLAGGAAVDNDDGTIDDALVSANATAGFSIVKFAGTGANATVGHGLAEAPNLIIIKRMESADDWAVGNDDLTNWQAYMHLNEDAASSGVGGGSYFNDTPPTASVFSVGTAGETNYTEDMIAYCFHSVEGYSKIGSYIGNGNADGTFVYLGFQPAYCIFKAIDEANGWFIWDSITNPANVMTKYLTANVNDAEGTYIGIDFLSNGLKFRSSSGSDGFNKDTINYIYMAFAESPFKYSNAR